MTSVGMGNGPLDNLPPVRKRDEVPTVPDWSALAGPGEPKRPRSGVRLLALGIVVALLGWIARFSVTDRAPDTAGLLGAHGVFRHYGHPHTLAIGVIVIGAMLALVGALRMTFSRR